MLKLSKKWIFYFLGSFFITFVAGFFVWITFISPDSGILSRVLAEADKISLKFFPASLSLNYEENSIVLEPLTEDVFILEESQPESADLEIQNPVIIEESRQDQLDDIQEKLDIISRQLQELVEERDQKALIEDEEISDKENQDGEEADDELNENQESENLVSYPKILISEVRILPIGQRFVELYNPNPTAVDLTGWYMQRKTESSNSWGSFVPSANFTNKTITAGGYFLISREFGGSNILSDITLSDNNSLIFKNPNGEISDQLGFGNASDSESMPAENPSPGQSIGRKTVGQDTDDNSADFELQTPTPGLPNIKYSSLSGGASGGGSVSAAYPKILISEVQISPADRRFVELYNPNSTDVDLTSWYLQRKDANDASWGSFVSATNFQNKRIPANGYFLISKEIADFDILSSLTLTSDNSLALKNPKGDISDKLGFGNALDFELIATVTPSSGQSIGRKVLPDSTEQDTADNSADFELDSPTPKLQNITYVEPLPPPAITLESIAITTPATKLTYYVGDSLDITGLVITGTYSDASTKAETIATENITGFDNSSPATDQVLTITFEGQTVTYLITVNEVTDVTSPSITTYTISNSTISPNGDGIEDTTSIDLAFSEDVKANVDIINSSGVKIRDLYSSSKVKNPDVKIWDGKDNSGTIVPDGVYTLTVVITDTAGDSVTDTSKTITVDNTAPLVTLSSDATITSAIYIVSPLTLGAGTVTNVPSGTSKANFETNLVKNQANQTWDDSGINDPVTTGNTLIVTAQDGTTKAIYTVTTIESGTTALTVLSFYPSNNSTDVPMDAKPSLTFSEVINPSTMNSSNIQLREYATSASDAKAVPAALTLSNDGTKVGFYLSSPLQYNKQYYFFVGSGFKDVVGNNFAKNTWYHAQRDSHEFTTAAE